MEGRPGEVAGSAQQRILQDCSHGCSPVAHRGGPAEGSVSKTAGGKAVPLVLCLLHRLLLYTNALPQQNTAQATKVSPSAPLAQAEPHSFAQQFRTNECVG